MCGSAVLWDPGQQAVKLCLGCTDLHTCSASLSLGGWLHMGGLDDMCGSHSWCCGAGGCSAGGGGGEGG